ncbi:MAG: cupin domain-containing protein [Rhodobacteraceae bacterium]|nr:cupin domain-containing protein [Paracoccaceae bacterium]
MPKIDTSAVPLRTGSSYPAPHDAPMAGRSFKGLAEAAGLTQFGANMVMLAPGGIASQRHWHEKEDEFLIMVSGELVLVEDDGETLMRPGECAAWKAGVANGHHMVNRSDAEASFLVIGTDFTDEVCWYSDIDMVVRGDTFTKKDGTPFEGET